MGFNNKTDAKNIKQVTKIQKVKKKSLNGTSDQLQSQLALIQGSGEPGRRRPSVAE